ncbi:DUF6397 family protein [Streptomyces iconiensis]|uniref:DUF6397 family protein n=1 Tax=Streptomyces iconiensis TaxID=1384038 RepID=A0ABT6ZVV7_9ACTN|nr:DUF6397 family protein [Streptomyces iconiensis]MDJ1132924.1 DUF6397 family protein [Streptomyces iconiensis]
MRSRTTNGQGAETRSTNMALRTAAGELGLWPRELELAVHTEEVRTVPGVPGGPRRVTREEIERVKSAEGFPELLRERLRLVGASEGATLMGISLSRFARLARTGHFSPVRFYVNRYRTVVWLYLAHELREFVDSSPELLKERMPRERREALKAGLDERGRRWRSRRVRQLETEAGGPWELAAARASVLDDDALAEAVPAADEQARLRALMPALAEERREPEAMNDALESLRVADSEEEVRTYQLSLHTALEEARSSAPLASHPATPAPEADPARPGPDTPHLVPGPPATVPRRRWSLRSRRTKTATGPAQ